MIAGLSAAFGLGVVLGAWARGAVAREAWRLKPASWLDPREWRFLEERSRRTTATTTNDGRSARPFSPRSSFVH